MTRPTLLRRLWNEWIRPFALPLLLITAAKSALADINPVPTGSMKPTVLEGDVVFVNKLAYDLKIPFTTIHLAHWADPARGDVVVCFAPDDGTRLLKRVIGRPGDTIELRNEQLFINGFSAGYIAMAPTDSRLRDMAAAERGDALFAREELGSHAHTIMVLPRRAALRTFAPFTLTADHYFMMGDNRDNSKDSRFFGVVDRRQIVGRATAVVISGDLGHFCQPRFGRFFTALE
jgi:signal peptidase I